MRAIVKVTRNYRITIPANIREELGIRVGDLLSVEVKGDRIILRKVIREIPTIRLGKELTINDIDRLIGDGLRRNLKTD